MEVSVTNSVSMENVLSFILGGKSEFTIYQEPGIQFKYKLKSNATMSLWYVYVLKESKYVYAGCINRRFSFFRGTKGCMDREDTPIRGLAWVLRHHNRLPEGVKVLHHGKCSVCNRALTDAKSLERGMGSTCYNKVKKLLGV